MGKTQQPKKKSKINDKGTAQFNPQHLKGTMNVTIRNNFGDLDSKTVINAHGLRKFARMYQLIVSRQDAVLAIEETRSTGACLITFEDHPSITIEVLCEECQE